MKSSLIKKLESLSDADKEKVVKILVLVNKALDAAKENGVSYIRATEDGYLEIVDYNEPFSTSEH